MKLSKQCSSNLQTKENVSKTIQANWNWWRPRFGGTGRGVPFIKKYQFILRTCVSLYEIWLFLLVVVFSEAPFLQHQNQYIVYVQNHRSNSCFLIWLCFAMNLIEYPQFRTNTRLVPRSKDVHPWIATWRWSFTLFDTFQFRGDGDVVAPKPQCTQPKCTQPQCTQPQCTHQ